jgi:Multimeric flavodoxin WrbA
MKKVIIVDASPRREGNSDVISEKLAAEIKGADVEIFKIREKDVKPCYACDACKGQDRAGCIQNDDISGMIPKIDACDAIALVTPIYFGQVSAQAKMFIDRMYCFFDPSKPGMSNASRNDKKAAMICTCGAGPVDVYKAYADSTVQAFGATGVSSTKTYVCGNVNSPGSCKNNLEYMKAVSEIAAWLSE